jgi:hypothetical protein
MAGVRPYYTTTTLMESIQNRIMFPFSQNTLSFNAVLQMINEELTLNAVPALREEHGEYFVYMRSTKLVSNIGIYPIPSRAQGMALRDLNWSDESGNFYEMVRIAEEDKAFFQYNSSNNQVMGKYYIQGNNIVMAPQVQTSPTGELNFFIFLRPNLLVRDERAAIIQGFKKPVTIVDNALMTGSTLLVVLGAQTSQPIPLQFTAVTGSPATPFEFLIGADATETALNLSTVINALALEGFSSTSTGPVVNTSYDLIATTFEVTGHGMLPDNLYTCVQFNQLPTTYIDPDTSITSDLYTQNCLVDFLQTNPGHKTFTYDVKLKAILPGNVGKFLTTELKTYLNNSSGASQPKQYWPIEVGDYICLANECIIPQIPPELHSMLAEMTASRILSALGDKEGYALSQNKLEQISKQQAALIGNRVEGSVVKVFNSSSLLRMGRGRRSRY